MTIKEKIKLNFYATCCNDCFFYCDGEGFGDPYCNQDELKLMGSKNFMYVRLSKIKVPDDCPARENSVNKYLEKNQVVEED